MIDAGVFAELERRGLAPAVLAAGASDESGAIAGISASERLVERANARERRERRRAFVDPILATLPVFPLDIELLGHQPASGPSWRPSVVGSLRTTSWWRSPPWSSATMS